jgi:hypothetical protein
LDTDRLNRWLSLIANVGVIVGIIFLAVEIQQSNRIAIAAAEIDIRNGLAAGNQGKYLDDEFAEIIAKLSDPDAELTPADQYRGYQYIIEGLNVFLAIETAHANGMLPQETYGIIEDDIRKDMKSYPKTIALYRQAHDNYPSLSQTDVFQTVERVLQDFE